MTHKFVVPIRCPVCGAEIAGYSWRTSTWAVEAPCEHLNVKGGAQSVDPANALAEARAWNIPGSWSDGWPVAK